MFGATALADWSVVDKNVLHFPLMDYGAVEAAVSLKGFYIISCERANHNSSVIKINPAVLDRWRSPYTGN